MQDYDTKTSYYLDHCEKRLVSNGGYIYETHTLLQKIGSVRGKSVMDLCCGNGRFGWTLIENGARSVVGVDISDAMLASALQKREQLPPQDQERVSFYRADLGNSDLELEPVDLVTGLYVLHYADSPAALRRMGEFIRRHMKPGGHCAIVTLNPELRPDPNLRKAQSEMGVYIDLTDGPETTMRIGDFSCRLWRWPREVIEEALAEAGLCEFTWTGRDVPADRPDLAEKYKYSIRHPHNVVLTARRADDLGMVEVTPQRELEAA